mgnify:CR=1 FL=1|tara:strand:- start:1406 stop:2134 length:729 start_codon:yes stop_codon:yes gene_type:complete
MATRITHAFTQEERKRYVKLSPEFDREAEVRQLALAAAAMIQWVDHAKATFSASTATRYLESLYWDPSNPNRIEMGVLPNTLADLLEYGQDPKDLNSIFLRKAKLNKKTHQPYRVIPIDDNRQAQYEGVGESVEVSQEEIRYYLQNMSTKIAKIAITSKMSRFSRVRAAAHSFKPAGKFIKSKGSVKFRTVTSPNTDVVNKPADIWKHPGIRAALIGNQISSWMEVNRASYISPIFNKEPGL